MELAELKETWSKLNEKMDKQQKLTDKVIMDIVKMKYNNKLKVILKYEGAGAVVLFIALIVIIWNIRLFDTIPLQICAMLSISMMVLLPVLSLRAVYRMNNIDMSKRTYKDTLIAFTKRRAHFLNIQKWSLVLSIVFMLAFIPLIPKITKGVNFFEGESNNLLWFFPIASIALFFFTRWAYACYAKITEDAQNILRELDD